MGTEEGSNSDSAESFCPTDEEIEKWMDSAFNMVGKGIRPAVKTHYFTYNT